MLKGRREEKEKVTTDLLYKWASFQDKGAIERFTVLLPFPSKLIPNLSELSLLLVPVLLEKKCNLDLFEH